jgi:hypothetical protein
MTAARYRLHRGDTCASRFFLIKIIVYCDRMLPTRRDPATL